MLHRQLGKTLIHVRAILGSFVTQIIIRVLFARLSLRRPPLTFDGSIKNSLGSYSKYLPCPRFLCSILCLYCAFRWAIVRALTFARSASVTHLTSSVALSIAFSTCSSWAKVACSTKAALEAIVFWIRESEMNSK